MDLAKNKSCKKCGTHITYGSRFCSNCGAMFSNEEKDSKEYQQVNEVSRSQPNSAKPPINNDKKYTSAISIKEKIKEQFFSYHGRLNRRDYFLRLLVVMACTGIIFIIMAIVEKNYRVPTKPLVVCYAALAMCVFSSIMLGIRRCHDLNRPAWFIGLTYIPVVGVFVAIYIIFAQGTTGINNYGDSLDDKSDFTTKASTGIKANQDCQLLKASSLQSTNDAVLSPINGQSEDSLKIIIERIKKEFFYIPRTIKSSGIFKKNIDCFSVYWHSRYIGHDSGRIRG